MDIPPYNTDLMIQVRDHVIEHPETHVQNIWVSRNECGTTACIAGWAVQLSGVEADKHQLSEYGETSRTADGRSVNLLATELLGLTDIEASHLFIESTTEDAALFRLEAMIEAGKNGERLCL